MSDDPFDTLDEQKRNLGGGGDYAPWWNKENFDVDDGDKLVGVVVEKHDYTDPGGDDHPVATIRSVGEEGGSHLAKGTEVSTPTRKGIEPLAEEANVGDLALIEYTGVFQANSGRDTHGYEASRMSQDEWTETSRAELIQEVWEGSDHYDGESGMTDVNESGSDGVPDKAVEFAVDAVQMNDGELTAAELDDFLNDVRDYGVDPLEAAEQADELEVDGDTVSLKED